MTSKERILQNFLVGLFGVTAFVLIATFSFIWLNGLNYNKATGSFEQTSVIAIESRARDVSVWFNGINVASSIPTQRRNLQPGYYEVEVRREGFHTFRKTLTLRAGQVGIIKGVVMIAEQPLISRLSDDHRFVGMGQFSTGLSLIGGELYDGSRLVTRFANKPTNIYRLNETYLYILNNEIRIFIDETSQDFLIHSADGPITNINSNPFSWTVAVQDASGNYLINLTEPSEALVESLESPAV